MLAGIFSVADAATFIMPRLPRPVQDEWRQIDGAIEDRQWGEAVQRLIPLLKRVEPGWVVEEEKESGERSGRVEGFRRYSARKIAAWPEEAKRVYEDAVAEELVEAARDSRKTGNSSMIAKAFGWFPHGGREAISSRLRGRNELDKGDREAAVRWGLASSKESPLPKARSLGAVSWLGQAQLNAETPHAVWAQAHRLVMLDRVGRMKAYDFQGLVVQEIMPPSTFAKWRSRPVLTSQDPGDGTVVLGYTAPFAATERWWGLNPNKIRRRAEPDPLGAQTQTEILRVDPVHPEPVRFTVQTDWAPSDLTARGGVFWMGGVKLQTGLVTPTVAQWNERGEKIWEVELGGVLTAGREARHPELVPSVKLACSGDGEYLGVLAESSLVLIHADSGEIEWMVSLADESPAQEDAQKRVGRRNGPVGFPGSSPRPGQCLVLDQTVVAVLPDGEGIVELDRRDGRVLWKRPGGPMEIGLTGATAGALLLHQTNGVEAIKRGTGERVWHYPLKPGQPYTGVPALWRESLLVPSGSQIIQLESATGREIRSWSRGQTTSCVFRGADDLLYTVSPFGFEVAVDEGRAVRLMTQWTSGFPVDDLGLLASLYWNRGETSTALTLAAESVKRYSGGSKRFAIQRLAGWCRSVASTLSGSPVIPYALETLGESARSVDEVDRIGVQWEVATTYEAAGRLEDAAAMYERLKTVPVEGPVMVEVAAGSRVNVRQLAGMRLQRLGGIAQATLASSGGDRLDGQISPETGRWVPSWQIPIEGSALSRLAIRGPVVALLGEGGSLRGYAVKDGALWWERKTESDLPLSTSNPQRGGQRLDFPGGRIQIDGMMVLRAEIFGAPPAEPVPEGGDVTSALEVVVTSTPEGILGLQPETGEVKWRVGFDTPVSQAPKLMVAYSLVVAAWQEGNELRVQVIRAENGEILWALKGVAPIGGVQVFSPSVFRPLKPVVANVVVIGSWLVTEEGTNILARDVFTGKEIWKKGLNRVATLLPDEGEEKNLTVLADPWTGWEQTTQVLPIRVEDGSPLAGVALPPKSRLLGATKTAYLILRADPAEISAVQRGSQAVLWSYPVARTMLTEGVYWCDRWRVGFQSGQEVKVVNLETGKEIFSAPLKRGASVTAFWMDDRVVAIATASELRLYTLVPLAN